MQRYLCEAMPICGSCFNMADCATADSTETAETEKAQTEKAETEKTEAAGGDIKVKDQLSHSDAVARHYNELQETGLESRAQSRIFYMRNFNNWIKSMLIADTLQKLRKTGDSRRKISVLDLCAGKGGDLRKWEKGRISNLICADIAQTSVEQAEERYKELVQRNKRERYPRDLFSAEFIAADCTKVRLKDVYKDPETQFDLVSCQFSFHYCFESYQQADVMLRNACEALKDGGYFIGSTPNSQEIMRRLGDSDSNSFGNDVYRVTFPDGLPDDRSETRLFGAKYDFHLEGVVDCPEFLVYFPALERMAESYGMKLLYKKPFAEFFEEFENEGEGRSLLGKMQALEPYPSEPDEKLLGEETQYSHAAKKLASLEEQNGGEADHRKNNEKKLGTLSQSEWEAISLYLVFVFQKVDSKQEEVADKSSDEVETKSDEKGSRSEKEQGTKRPLDRETTDDEPQEKQSKTTE